MNEDFEEIELPDEEFEALQGLVDELRNDGYSDEEIEAVMQQVLAGSIEEVEETDVNGDGDTDVTATDVDGDGKADEVEVTAESKKEGDKAAEKAADKLGDDDGKLDSTGNVASDDKKDKKDEKEDFKKTEAIVSDEDEKECERKKSWNERKAENEGPKWKGWKKGNYGFGGNKNSDDGDIESTAGTVSDSTMKNIIGALYDKRF